MRTVAVVHVWLHDRTTATEEEAMSKHMTVDFIQWPGTKHLHPNRMGRRPLPLQFTITACQATREWIEYIKREKVQK